MLAIDRLDSVHQRLEMNLLDIYRRAVLQNALEYICAPHLQASGPLQAFARRG